MDNTSRFFLILLNIWLKISHVISEANRIVLTHHNTYLRTLFHYTKYNVNLKRIRTMFWTSIKSSQHWSLSTFKRDAWTSLGVVKHIKTIILYNNSNDVNKLTYYLFRSCVVFSVNPQWPSYLPNSSLGKRRSPVYSSRRQPIIFSLNKSPLRHFRKVKTRPPMKMQNGNGKSIGIEMAV